jgi:hypothetical protein
MVRVQELALLDSFGLQAGYAPSGNDSYIGQRTRAQEPFGHSLRAAHFEPLAYERATAR